MEKSWILIFLYSMCQAHFLSVELKFILGERFNLDSLNLRVSFMVD
jgi:hypothetical protein